MTLRMLPERQRSGQRLLVTVLVAASLSAVAAPALAAPGDLDSSFAGEGMLTIDYGGFDLANAVLVQPDGKIVTAGGGGVGNTFAVTRVNPDGSPDYGFGNLPVDFSGSIDTAHSVALQPDGKLVVAGHTQAETQAGTNRNVAIARLNANGSLDTSFAVGGSPNDLNSENGKLEIDYGGTDVASDVLVQPDGKIVAAGPGGAGGTFAVTRLNADGSPDFGFGNVPIDFGGYDIAHAVALQSDGKLVIAGHTHQGTKDNVAIARLTSNGTLDTSFARDGSANDLNAEDGKLEIDYGGTDVARDILVQPDGKIVTGGQGGAGGTFAVTRLNADGSPDFGFGNVPIDFGDEDVGSAAVLQPDGKIVVAGWSADNVAVARLQPGGSLDTTFHFDGRRTFDFEGGDSGASGLALQPDGRLVTAGSTTANVRDVAVARLEGDPVPSGGPGGGPGRGVPRCGGKRATIVGTAGRERLRGTRRADVIVTLAGSDSVKAGAGSDLICGGTGKDRLAGQSGKDRLFGQDGKDTLLGGPGNDGLSGGGRADRLLGQAGRDKLTGGPGRDDSCSGGPGHDRMACERQRA